MFRRNALRCACAALLCSFGCELDMVDQPRLGPLQRSELFPGKQAARQPPTGTVARDELEDDELLYRGTVAGRPADEFPFAIGESDLQRGRERYEIHCVPCHGVLGDGQGMIAQRGLKAPPSYHEQRLRAAPAGYFFTVITHGFGRMLSYAADIHPRDRWRIVAYIRALQLSQNASLAQLSPRARAQLAREAP
jgi:mono/diheme cytochrome c family protein